MVLGIGEGKIEIVLEKQSYSAGEKMKGKLKLTLSNPKKAKELRVAFYGLRTVKTHSLGPHGRPTTSSRTEKVYPQEISLGGEKEYPAGVSEYGFELQMPTPQKRVPGANIVSDVLGALTGDPWAHVKWYLDASLSLPMSFDINRKMQISFVF